MNVIIIVTVVTNCIITYYYQLIIITNTHDLFHVGKHGIAEEVRVARLNNIADPSVRRFPHGRRSARASSTKR